MFFSDIQIYNYKSYRDSGRLDLAKGINILVGRNNVGKTALLEALSLKFDANHHRAIDTSRNTRMPRPESLVAFTFTVSRHELIDLLVEAQGDSEFHLPLPALHSPLAQQLNIVNYHQESGQVFGEWFFSHKSYTFRLQREAYGPFPRENWHIDDKAYIAPQFERNWQNQRTLCYYVRFRVDPIEGTCSFFGSTPVSGGEKSYDDFILRIARLLNRYIYRFKAERIASEHCDLGLERTLAPNAANLAEVLSLLQDNHVQLNEYNQLVREVLPYIYQVNSRRLENNRGEVVIWNDEGAISRNDLAFTLKECGSGVGQVLAILYVVLTAREPQVIILDEPQGFLHPGAVRKLLEVLRRHTKEKHQLVIATHSPTVITSAEPSSVTMIKQEGSESVFEAIDIMKVTDQRTYLANVGARLSDVFGYDRVLWVEGVTEEICFPLILQVLTEKHLMGTAILRVQHTGDFNRKDTKNVIEIYKRLSQLEGGLVPPVVGFIFDREIRSEREIEDLKKQSDGKIHFTPRRMFENYLLNPTGIASILSTQDLPTITESQVSNWLEQNKTASRYYKGVKSHGDEPWHENVDGAALLFDLFKDLSAGKVHFEKTVHSPMLTKWLLHNSAEELRELSDLTERILSDETIS